MECMGVASGSGWNLWVWLAGGGCACKEAIASLFKKECPKIRVKVNYST